MGIPIRGALITGTAGLLTITFVMFLSFSYVSIEQVLNSHVRELTNEKVLNVIKHVEKDLSLAQSIAELTARLLSSGGLDETDNKALEQHLFQQLALLPSLAGAYIGWSNGDFLYVKNIQEQSERKYRTLSIMHRADGRQVNKIWRNRTFEILERERNIEFEYDPRARLWYQETIEAGRTIWVEPYLFKSSRKPGITVASPVRSAEGAISMVVGLDMDIYGMSNLLRNLDFGPDGAAFIVSQKGDLIATSNLAGKGFRAQQPSKSLPNIHDLKDPVLIQSIATLTRPLDKFTEGIEEYNAFSINQTSYHTFITRFHNSNWPWAIGLSVPDAFYLDDLTNNRNFYLLIVFGIALTLIGLTIMMARTITRPIEALSHIATSIRDHGFGNHPRVSSRYKELNNFANTFAELINDLQKREQENASLTAERIAIINNSASVIYMKDRDGRYILVNQHFEDLFNIANAEIKGKTDHDIFPNELADVFRENDQKVFEEGVPVEFEEVAPQDDGPHTYLSVKFPLFDQDDRIYAVCGISTDITKRKQAEEAVKSSLAEKEVLIQEIHHRVKNNLQVVSSMLYLQCHTERNDKVVTALSESRRRIEVMVRVHESLYQSSDLSHILAKEFINAIVSEELLNLGDAKNLITLETKIDNISLDIDSAITCGQIISELASNSVKHAFPDGRKGVVVVSMQQTANDVVKFSVMDNGVGLPDDFEWENSDSLGLQLVNRLAKKIRGDISVDSENGTNISISFKPQVT